MDRAKHPFAKFVSPVEGHVVSRYGSARHGRGAAPIGYTRELLEEADPDAPISMTERGAGKLVIIEGAIVPIPEAEWQRFRREYSRALRNGSLTERTADEYFDQIEAAKKDREKAQKQIEAAEKKAASDAKKAAKAKAKQEAAAQP